MHAPRIVNDVSCVTRINHEIHFAWQAQYLVKLECDFSWQAQHLVTFWEIAGARNEASAKAFGGFICIWWLHGLGFGALLGM